MLESLFGLNAKLGALRATLSDTWAAKLDALRTGMTDARMALLDKLTALDQLTTTRGGYLDLLPDIRTKAARAVKLRSTSLMLTEAVASTAVPLTNTTIPATFLTVLSISGAGALRFFGVSCPNSNGAYVRITVDGLTVFDKAVFNSSGSQKLAVAVGSVVSDGVNKLPVFDDLVFQSSLVVEIRLTTAATTAYYVAYETY